MEKKARIALRLASGRQHGFFDALFRAAFGKGPEELGIEMVDMSPAEAMLFPKGLDAVVSHAVIPYMMKHRGVAKFLVNNEGVPDLPGKAVSARTGRSTSSRMRARIRRASSSIEDSTAIDEI